MQKILNLFRKFKCSLNNINVNLADYDFGKNPSERLSAFDC